MRKSVLVLSAILAIAGVRAAGATDPVTGTTVTPTLSEMNAHPTDGSPLHTMPVILGEVASTTEHSVTLNTARGETMTFETDSRTVMPLSLQESQPVRVEFHLLDNGMHHAGRIATITAGSSEYDRLQQQLAANRERRAAEEAAAAQMAQNEQQAQGGTTESQSALGENATPQGQSNVETTREEQAEHDRAMGENNGAANSEPSGTANDDANSRKELPQTGDSRVWMLIVGLGLFAAAFGQRMFRRRHA